MEVDISFCEECALLWLLEDFDITNEEYAIYDVEDNVIGWRRIVVHSRCPRCLESELD